jgi:hypothetical protein
MGCPYCKEPIEVAESGDSGVGDELDDDPVEKPPLVFRRIENSGSAAGASSSEPAATATGSVGERRKHRKRNTDLYDWDDEKSEDAGSKSGNNAPDDDSSEFLEMDPDTPGAVRLKRVRRKKILTTRDKALRILTATLFVAAAAIAGFIIYSAIMQTSKVITTEAKTLQELPDEIRKLIDQAKDDPITDNLTQAEEEIATSVLNGYLNAKTIDERLQFVRDQERVKPIMEKWYADNPEEATKEWPDGEILLRKKIIDGKRYFIILAVDFEGEGKRILAIEQKLDGEMRILGRLPADAARRVQSAEAAHAGEILGEGQAFRFLQFQFLRQGALPRGRAELPQPHRFQTHRLHRPQETLGGWPAPAPRCRPGTEPDRRSPIP